MPTGPGCQVHAGIIHEDGTLSARAKKKFIQAVKDELTYGTDNIPSPPLFPCGASIPANEFAYLLDLENEEKFPEFHKNILGTYQRIAQSLNLASDFKILPICCPVSLGLKLGVKISVPNFPLGFIPYMIPNPALLALKMKVMPPPKLVAQFPNIPSLPPPIPQFKIPPDIKLPEFTTFFDFTLAYELGIPKFIATLVASMPRFVLKFPNLPDMFKEICGIAFDSQIFGNITPSSVTEMVAVKVLTTKVVEMSFIAATGTTIGSSPGGVVGGIGRFLGYDPEFDEGEDDLLSVRDRIVNAALECEGLSYGNKNTRELYAQKLLYVEYPEPTTGPGADPRALGKKATLGAVSEASSCGMFVRWCMFSAGASYVLDKQVDTSRQDPQAILYHDFFKDRYAVGEAIDGLYKAAAAKHALIKKPKGDLPPLKRGDVIIVERKGDPGAEHVILLVADYVPGSFEMTTIEGGQIDPLNDDKYTAILRKEYIKGPTVPKGSKKYSMFVNADNEVDIAGRTILAIIDGERLCTDPTGSSMTQPNLNTGGSVANDGPGAGFQKEE